LPCGINTLYFAGLTAKTMFKLCGVLDKGNVFQQKRKIFKKVRKKRPFFRFVLATIRFYAYIIISTQGVALLNFKMYQRRTQVSPPGFITSFSRGVFFFVMALTVLHKQVKMGESVWDSEKHPIYCIVSAFSAAPPCAKSLLWFLHNIK
jgi:hypothetical protein